MTHSGGSLCLTEALLAPDPAFVLQESARIQRNWVFQSNSAADCGVRLYVGMSGLRTGPSSDVKSGRIRQLRPSWIFMKIRRTGSSDTLPGSPRQGSLFVT